MEWLQLWRKGGTNNVEVTHMLNAVQIYLNHLIKIPNWLHELDLYGAGKKILGLYVPLPVESILFRNMFKKYQFMPTPN